MSHYLALVLVNPNCSNVEDEVSRLLAPYDENTEVEPYEEKCWCVGSTARHKARESAYAEVGNIDSYRESYHNLIEQHMPEKFKSDVLQSMSHDDFMAVLDVVDAERNKIEKQFSWKKHIAVLTDLEDKLYSQHPLCDKPDPDCNECGGTGSRWTTYNPNSKWDWWVIGGRWSDALRDNMVIVKDMTSEERCGFAIVTPDGEWIEQGKMGWWAIVTDEKDEDDWVAERERVLNRYENALAVAVDLHI